MSHSAQFLTTVPDRWVQLAYTSADTVQGARGGWGILDITPNAPDDLVDLMTEGLLTRVDEVEETSPFASAEVLERRARVLTYRRASGRSLLWHTTPASRDATGRPGNVMCHAATPAGTEDLGGWRPIDLWRSPGWLTPFGPQEVAASRVGTLPLGSRVTRERVVDWLVDPAHERRFAFEWMLAVLAHGVASRKPVVLACADPDEAAMWIGAFSHFTSALHAQRRLTWSTFVRARAVIDGRTTGLALVAAPREDFATLSAEGPSNLLLVDPLWEIDEPVGRSWVLPTGVEVPAGISWEAAALDILALPPDESARVLQAMDVLCGAMTPSQVEALPLSWPLEVALLDQIDGQVADRDALLITALERAPGAFLNSDAGQRLVRDLVADVDDDDLRAIQSETDGSALGDEIAWRLAVDHLSGGWCHKPTPVWNERVLNRLRTEGEALVRTALAAVGTHLSAPAEVLCAAQLLDFILRAEIDPSPESDHAPSPMEAPLALVRDALAGVANSLDPDALDLLSEQVLPHRTPEISTPPPTPVVNDSGAGFVPGVHFGKSGQAIGDSGSPISSLRDLGRNVGSTQSDRWRWLVSQMTALPHGSEIAAGLAEARLVVDHGGTLATLSPRHVNEQPEIVLTASYWIAGNAPWTLIGDLAGPIAWARVVADSPLVPENGQTSAAVWLAVEASIARALGGNGQFPDQAMRWLHARPDDYVSAYVRALVAAPRETTLAVLRSIYGSTPDLDPVLGRVLTGGRTVGQRVVAEAMAQAPARLQPLLNDLTSQTFPAVVNAPPTSDVMSGPRSAASDLRTTPHLER